jgi:argininosuccinate lyase
MIVKGLTAIAKEIADDRFTWDLTLEDVHTNIEAALVRRIGDAGKRLHTGRSRNDQIATDVRLWARDQVDGIVGKLRDLQAALAAFAETHRNVVMPGYTHLQHAQPVLLAHHALAYFEMFARDRQRFVEMRSRARRIP